MSVIDAADVSSRGGHRGKRKKSRRIFPVNPQNCRKYNHSDAFCGTEFRDDTLQHGNIIAPVNRLRIFTLSNQLTVRARPAVPLEIGLAGFSVPSPDA
ncbi:hypothetical protein [Pandoraea sp. NPDC087047]|uniref:hypothetical protein n=1 Tax=Pandoraea sp. NPDC087047 TaxID=3364390 RepID=UPI0037F83591